MRSIIHLKTIFSILSFFFVFFSLHSQCDNPTTIVLQPLSQVVCEGEDIVISVTASGENVSYLWYRGGIPITGLNVPTLSLTNVRLFDAQEYYVEVSGDCGSETSDLVTLEVEESGIPSVELFTLNDTVCKDDDIQLVANGFLTGYIAVYEFRDINSNSLLQSGSSNSHMISVSQDVSIEVSMTSSSNCLLSSDNIALDTIQLSVVTSEIADAGDDFFTCSESFNLSATGQGSWSSSNQNVVILEPNNPNSLVEGLGLNEVADFVWLVENGNCETFLDTIQVQKINEATVPDISLNNQIVTSQQIDICENDTVTLVGTETSGFETGIWEIVSGNSVSVVEGSSLNLLGVTGSTAGVTELKWVINPNLGGCLPEESHVSVKVFEAPKGEILSLSDTALCPANDDQLVITTEQLNTGDVGVWGFDGVSSINTRNGNDIHTFIYANFDLHGLNVIEYNVGNNGCNVTYTDSIWIDKTNPMWSANADKYEYCIEDTIFITINYDDTYYSLDKVRYGEYMGDGNVIGIPASNWSTPFERFTGISFDIDIINTDSKCITDALASGFVDVMLYEASDPIVNVNAIPVLGQSVDLEICNQDTVVLFGENKPYGEWLSDGTWYKDGAVYSGGENVIIKDDGEWREYNWQWYTSLRINEPGAYVFERDIGRCQTYSDTIKVGFEIPSIAFPNAINSEVETVSGNNITLEAVHDGLRSYWSSSSDSLQFTDPESSITIANLQGDGEYAYFTSISGGCSAHDSVFVKLKATGFDQVLYSTSSSLLEFEGLENEKEMTLHVFNSKGVLIKELFLGDHKYWDANSLSLGTYVYRLIYGTNQDKIRTGKLLILD